MVNCSALYFLSALACQLTECMPEDELAILAADLMTLSDMLASIAARQDACAHETASTLPLV
jgi:hypothetical protein